jgi:hypothetical protein
MGMAAAAVRDKTRHRVVAVSIAFIVVFIISTPWATMFAFPD